LEQIEGRICVEAALKARLRKISLLVIRQGLHHKQIESILNEADQQHISIKYVSHREIDALSHGKTHGGVIALATPKPPISIEALLDQLKKQNQSCCPALLLLEGIDDNQNLGFTLRSAEAMGIHAVLLKKHLWNFDSNAVSRASSAAYERMPVALLDRVEKVLPKFKNRGFTLYGCIANAKRTMYEADLTKSVILAIGGEKRGLSASVRNHCDRLIKIPMASDVGSLSLSHASSIIMAELMRQRIKKNSQIHDELAK
jgi:23S rRNA (guanosine2251-2'-O)-methyltransferase